MQVSVTNIKCYTKIDLKDSQISDWVEIDNASLFCTNVSYVDKVTQNPRKYQTRLKVMSASLMMLAYFVQM